MIELKLRRGTDAERAAMTPADGEPIWTTDSNELWIGDGATAGGNLVGPGSVGGPDSFTTIDCPSGTDPVAASATDTLTITSGTDALVIEGDSGTNTIDFSVAVAVSAGDAGLMTGTDKAKLDAIEAGADVTDATNVATAGAVMDTDYDAYSILMATTDNTPVALQIAEQRLVGRITGGVIDDLTATQARTLLNVENGADVTDATNVDAAGAVMATDYDAHSILAATADDTPSAVTVAENTLVGRKAGGSIDDLTASEVRTILNVEDGADVTDAANVASSGAVMASLLDAAGDMIVATAADTPARLAVGTVKGHVLQVDLTRPQKMKWASVGTAIGGTNSFVTIDCPDGTDPVADTDTDTLTLESGTTALTITGSSAAKSVTLAVADAVASTASGLLSGADKATIDGLGGLAALDAVEGTAVLSTSESGGSKFLREDGDGTCSWQAPPAETSHADVLVDGDFDAYSILAATTVDTPFALTVGEQTVVGRKTGGVIAALTGAEVLAIADGAASGHTHSAYVAKATYDAYSILAATTDDIPAALTVGEQTIVGRKTGGAIAALTGAEVLSIAGGAAASHSHAISGVTGLQTQLDARTTWSGTWTGTATVLVSDASTGGLVNQSAIAASDILKKSDYNANTILAATADDTPAALTVGEQTLVGRITSGAIAALTAAQVRTLLGTPGHIFVAAASDHTINNSDTYTQDTTFNGIALEANSVYQFQAYIPFQLVSSATPDWKVRFYFNQTDWKMFCTYVAAANASANESSSNYCTMGAITNTSTGTRLNQFEGIIKTATAGTFEMQWAQNTATAENTLRRSPAVMLFTKVA